MSNVIQFMEAAGRNPALSAAEYAATVEALDVDASQRRALHERDPHAINALLEGRETLYCLVCTPDSDEPKRDDEDDDGVPDQDVPAPTRTPVLPG